MYRSFLRFGASLNGSAHEMMVRTISNNANLLVVLLTNEFVRTNYTCNSTFFWSRKILVRFSHKIQCRLIFVYLLYYSRLIYMYSKNEFV